MASIDPKMSKQGTVGNRKHVTLMIPYKLQMIARLESGKSQKEVMASYKRGYGFIQKRLWLHTKAKKGLWLHTKAKKRLWLHTQEVMASYKSQKEVMASYKSQKEVMASYKSAMSTIHDKQKRMKLWSFMVSNEGGRTFSTLKEPKFVQMDKVLSKQVDSQITNVVGTAASSMGAHMYIHLYTYIMLYSG